MGVKIASDKTLKRVLNDIMDEKQGYEYCSEVSDLYNNIWYELQERYGPDEEENVTWGQMKGLCECGVAIPYKIWGKICQKYWETAKQMVKIYKQYINGLEMPSREETKKEIEKSKSLIQTTLF